ETDLEHVVDVDQIPLVGQGSGWIVGERLVPSSQFRFNFLGGPARGHDGPYERQQDPSIVANGDLFVEIGPARELHREHVGDGELVTILQEIPGLQRSWLQGDWLIERWRRARARHKSSECQDEEAPGNHASPSFSQAASDLERSAHGRGPWFSI